MARRPEIGNGNGMFMPLGGTRCPFCGVLLWEDESFTYDQWVAIADYTDDITSRREMTLAGLRHNTICKGFTIEYQQPCGQDIYCIGLPCRKCEIRSYFTKLMNMVDGVHAIVVTDHDGVPILQVKDDHVHENMLKSNLLGMSGSTIDQGSKVGLGQTRNVNVVFAKFQLVCFNKLPLIVTVYADKTANTGHILSLEPDFANVVNGMRQIVDIPVV